MAYPCSSISFEEERSCMSFVCFNFKQVKNCWSIKASTSNLEIPSPGCQSELLADEHSIHHHQESHQEPLARSTSTSSPSTSNFRFRMAASISHSSLPLPEANPLFSADTPWCKMASSDVDTKFLGKFADNIEGDSPFLAAQLYQILGNLTVLSSYVIKARKLRRLDTTRHTKSADLYCRIIWYARAGLKLLEELVLPMVARFTQLKALAYKLRASYYHLYVLFHNKPPVSLKAGHVHTPPGLKSPRAKLDKGKGIDRGTPEHDRPSSVQPTHPLEGGPVGGAIPPEPLEYAPDFLVPAEDYRPIALACFQEACAIADKNLWGSHPLRLSAKVEFCAFLYDCLHDRDRSRQLAKVTIAEVYNAQEGMDDDMFEDAAEMVGILGRMMKRGLGSGSSTGTPGGSTSTPVPGAGDRATMPMLNPI